MTLRVGRFKHKTVASYYYIKSLAYEAITGCHFNVIGCGSLRKFSHLSIETPPGNSQYPSVSEGDPVLSRCRENSATSTYKELLTQFTNVLNVKGDNSSNGKTVSQGKWQKHSEPQLDTSKFWNEEGRPILKFDSCDTRVKNSLGNLDTTQQACSVSEKNFVQRASQPELQWNAETTNNGPGDPDEKKSEKTKPDQQDLERVKDYYIEIIPKLYKINEDMSLNLHHKDIVFQNNYFEKPKRIHGIPWYRTEQNKMRISANFRFPTFFFQTVAATTHLDESCVKVHWRFYYLGNWEYLTKYLFRRTKGVSSLECLNTTDGISTFVLNKDGAIIKHQVDRLLPIQKAEADSLRPKFRDGIATALGIAPAPKTNFESNFSQKKAL